MTLPKLNQTSTTPELSDPPPAAGRRPPAKRTSAAARPRKVSLSRITVDQAIQPRFLMSKDVLIRYTDIYRTAPNEMPPVTLAIVEDGGLVMVDGFHRLEAARRARMRDIKAIVVEGRTRAELMWLAVEENYRNGLPIGRAERRVIFRRFVRAEQNRLPNGTLMSSRDFPRALQFGSHQTFLNWMKEDFPRVYEEMGGKNLEEDELEQDDENREEEQMIQYIEYAEYEYLRMIEKGGKTVPKELVAKLVRGIEERISRALGVASLAELLPEDDEPNDDF